MAWNWDINPSVITAIMTAASGLGWQLHRSATAATIMHTENRARMEATNEALKALREDVKNLRTKQDDCYSKISSVNERLVAVEVFQKFWFEHGRNDAISTGRQQERDSNSR